MNYENPHTETTNEGLIKVPSFFSSLTHIELQYATLALNRYLENLSYINQGIDISKQLETNKLRQKPTFLNESGEIAAKSNSNIKGKYYAHLKLIGTMRSGDDWCQDGIDTLIGQIREANDDSAIKGMMLEVESGGGESIAGDKLFVALDDFRKPKVKWFHYSGSAAVKGTLPIRDVIASNTSAQIGSIGTYLTISKGFAEAYNQYYTDIYATKSVNKNKGFRDLTKGNLSTLQSMVDVHNDQFTDIVQAYRPLRQSDMDHTLSGAMFFAQEAKMRGLVTQIGGMRTVMSRLQTLSLLNK